jgi:putative membrane protein
MFLFSCLLMAPVLGAQTHEGRTSHGAAAKPLTDQQFVDFAAQTDMTEAHMGQVAQDQAQSQGVKDYGQTLNTDHTADYNQLTAAATKANLTVPKGLDAVHEKMIAPMAKLKGAAFDRQFTRNMITGHEAALAIYKREADNAQNADLKAYASAAIPVLQKHLTDAQDLMKKHTK